MKSVPDRNLPGLITDAEGEPIFNEPWQAQIFAIVVALNEAGHFTWVQWAETLGTVLKQTGESDRVEDYFHHWAKALEQILAVQNILPTQDINIRAEQWRRAALATPHGEPIVLDNDPQT